MWRDCRYVYPVVSRRARGVSIGVNLNGDQRCTFGCLYCQVLRSDARPAAAIDIEVLAAELREAFEATASGELWDEPRYASTPEAMRRLNDIAFSGDGEPTCVREFSAAVATAARVKRQRGRDDVKIVVITNASLLDAPHVQQAMGTLDENNGEIWAKLDAGTESYFQQINRPKGGVILARIVAKIVSVAQDRPVVIQTLFPCLDGKEPPSAEIDAYIDRLGEILSAGGQIKAVQLHTIARSPLSPRTSCLAEPELQRIAGRIRSALPQLAVDVYPGCDVPPQRC